MQVTYDCCATVVRLWHDNNKTVTRASHNCRTTDLWQTNDSIITLPFILSCTHHVSIEADVATRNIIWHFAFCIDLRRQKNTICCDRGFRHTAPLLMLNIKNKNYEIGYLCSLVAISFKYILYDLWYTNWELALSSKVWRKVSVCMNTDF